MAKALTCPVPAKRKKPPPRKSVLEPVKGFIDAMLREDLDTWKKQKHTIARVLERLASEHDFELAAYSTVRDYVAKRRSELALEARQGRRHLEGTVPQEKRPGEEAEVDFADVWLDLAGQRRKCVLLTLRMSYSGKAIHRVYATASQEAFLEGHVEAFRALGGVPTVHIRYDNLKPAVKQVLFGRSRTETTRWVSFRSWYGYSAFYCAPGEEGAHEKGGVEHEGGRFRRKHLVPAVAVDSLAELNERLAAIDAAEDSRHVHGRPTSIGFDFEQERPLLAPLPADEYDTGIDLTPVVHRNGRVTVRQCHYSVPAKFIGMKVRVKLRANEVWVFDGRRVIARHPRLTRRYTYHDVLDHYLEILLVKPGAFRRSRRARAGPRRRRLHQGSRGVLGRGQEEGGQQRGHPDADRGVVAAPPDAARRGHHWDGHRPQGRLGQVQTLSRSRPARRSRTAAWKMPAPPTAASMTPPWATRTLPSRARTVARGRR
ncbi:IS21 family transposase [Streptomyces sp. NRRL B-2790]|uniref:IS21 family transposase n=1 Tax=Streptomyces sp. NRRL B-2790 TaxID=1463835 RepID=UPI00356A4197